MSEKAKPCAKFRSGNLTCAVWRNANTTAYWYTVTLSRSYRDADQTWKDTSSLNGHDLLTAAGLCKLAWDWIMGNDAAADPEPGSSG